MPSRSYTGHPRWQFRVLRTLPHTSGNDGNIQGGALFFAPDFVVTCAHVVCNVTGLDFDRDPEPPQVPVCLDSVGISDWEARATVVPGCWWTRDGSDLAVLRLTESSTVPEDLVGPEVRLEHQSLGSILYSCGYPRGREAGDPVEVRLLGAGGSSPNEFKLVSTTTHGSHIRLGFSGCAVRDVHGATCGIVVQSSRRQASGEAWMLAMDEVAAALRTAGAPALSAASPRSGEGFPEFARALRALPLFRRRLSPEELGVLFRHESWPGWWELDGDPEAVIRVLAGHAPDRWALESALEGVEVLEWELGYREGPIRELRTAAEPLMRRLDRERTGDATYDALHDFLAATPLEEVAAELEALCRLRPELDGRGRPWGDTAWSAFTAMWTWLPPKPGQPAPAVVWVHLVAARNRSRAVPASVGRWLEQQRGDRDPEGWAEGLRAAEERTAAAATLPERPARLLISVAHAPRGYELDYRVRRSAEGGWLPLDHDPRRTGPFPREELAAKILGTAEKVREDLELPRFGPPLRLEPVLPESVPDLALPEAPAGRGRSPARAGAKYPIVLHLRERMDNGGLASKCRTAEDAAGARIVWAGNTRPELLASTLAAPEAVACVLSRSPDLEREELDYLLDGDVPAALWSREPDEPKNGINMIKGTGRFFGRRPASALSLLTWLFSEDPDAPLREARADLERFGLPGLPEILLKLRRESYRDTDSHTQAISYKVDFLYDDHADVPHEDPFHGGTRLSGPD